MQLLIVADDLTGALDSAVALAGVGLGCVVARRPGDVGAAPAADVLSVSTSSRETTEGHGVLEVMAGVGALPDILFKKVDSRMKGHVVREVGDMARAAGLRRALVAPGIPAQGRFVVDGRVTGAGVAVPIDVAAAVAGTGLDIEVPDTRSDADFDAPLERALSGTPALLVGAAGLAAALARRLAPGAPRSPVPRLAAPILLAIGSHDPITLAQVERLASQGTGIIATAPDGYCPPLAAARATVVRLVPGEGVFDPRQVGARFADGIAAQVRAHGIRTLFACGGETADAILGALGVGILTVEGEILPGVPVSRMMVDGRPMQLVTKSGGFGDAEALVAVVAAALEGEG